MLVVRGGRGGECCGGWSDGAFEVVWWNGMNSMKGLVGR